MIIFNNFHTQCAHWSNISYVLKNEANSLPVNGISGEFHTRDNPKSDALPAVYIKWIYLNLKQCLTYDFCIINAKINIDSGFTVDILTNCTYVCREHQSVVLIYYWTKSMDNV